MQTKIKAALIKTKYKWRAIYRLVKNAWSGSVDDFALPRIEHPLIVLTAASGLLSIAGYYYLLGYYQYFASGWIISEIPYTELLASGYSQCLGPFLFWFLVSLVLLFICQFIAYTSDLLKIIVSTLWCAFVWITAFGLLGSFLGDPTETGVAVYYVYMTYAPLVLALWLIETKSSLAQFITVRPLMGVRWVLLGGIAILGFTNVVNIKGYYDAKMAWKHQILHTAPIPGQADSPTTGSIIYQNSRFQYVVLGSQNSAPKPYQLEHDDLKKTTVTKTFDTMLISTSTLRSSRVSFITENLSLMGEK